MTDTFQSRIPTLPDEELRKYARDPRTYKREAVAAALAELQRRGLAVPADDVRRIQAELEQREAAHVEAQGRWLRRALGATASLRRARVRAITAAILVAGLGWATAIYVTARPPAPNALGYEPEDTKKYLRDLEVFGGKTNVLATEFMRWFNGLWQGRQLATTVATLTVALAGSFWLIALPQTREAQAASKDGPADPPTG
jgi:hypothetical protein